MFADPLVVEDTSGLSNASGIAGHGTLSFTCIGRGLTSSTYRFTYSATNYLDLMIGRQVGKRIRDTVRLTEYELVSDVTNTTASVQKQSTAYVVIDRSLLGNGTHQTNMEQVLSAFLRTFTDAASLASRVRAGET
jgi:hypothetical protein